MGAQGLSEPAVAAGRPGGAAGTRAAAEATSPRGPQRARRPRSPRRPPHRRRALVRLAYGWGYPAGLAGLDGVAAATVYVVVSDVQSPAGPVLGALGVVGLNLRDGGYRPPRSPSLFKELRSLAPQMAVLALVVAALDTAPRIAGHAGAAGAALLWLVGAAAGCAIALSGRALSYAVLGAVRSGRAKRRRALVIGNGPVSAHVAAILRQRGEFGLQPVGCIDTGFPAADVPAEMPVLGGCDEIYRIMQDHRVRTVVIAAEEVERRWVDAIVRICSGLCCETLLVLSPADSLAVTGARVDHLAGTPFVWLPAPGHGGLGRPLKRVFDVAVALAALVLLLPVLIGCAVAVRVDTGPGVLFRQRRIGLKGKEFVLLKFRTLRPADEHEAETRWNVDGDERMGAIGKFLRDTCLDELPQLWNVVRGDMSLVGPRPERPHFVQSFSESCPGYTLRHRVRGGMTGWSQVHGLRGDTSIDLRARFDNHYIDTWTFTGDLKVLLMTLRVVLMRKSG
ncbi:exopolysaccharide biosynthesis polyprenyl glycosylphosphotransferase [Spirillospora sp. NBC_01491]|uniref:exopolysaccharide biosynthesis polyprenyl glycosylphosphotransferase n=1 Tax=Spirillospora sp. NBC_01491 TaxID=2976007 RepID=UPI002E31C243|nr:exopolysaccharide biosynthesis polyprenyl glycosylphosphotransferase [Spirillospora sp. NBC_01491]